MCANYEWDLEEELYDKERSGPREIKEKLNHEDEKAEMPIPTPLTNQN